MRLTGWVVGLVVLSGVQAALGAEATGSAGAGGAGYKAEAGASTVGSVDAEWKDAKRVVLVPVKVYFPKESKQPSPVIVFSHGLGGSRETYRIWAEHWASWGYVVVVPTHVGSDTSLVVRGAARGGGTGGARAGLMGAINADQAAQRVSDVKFVIDELEKIQAGTLAGGEGKGLEPLKGKLDVKHIGMGGHSYGAQTTLAIAGEAFPAGALKDSVDPRVTAAIAMSPQEALATPQRVAFGSIKIPVIHMTGTADEMLGVTPPQRRVPYDFSTYPETYLVVFEGATHMSFAPTATGVTLGSRLGGASAGTNTPEQEKRIHTLIKESTTAFWDAYLKGDAKAKSWLTGEFSKVMGKSGTFEMKKK